MTDSAEKDPEQGPETEPSPEDDRPPRSANATLQEPSARRSTAAQVSEPSSRHRDPDFGPRYRVVSLLGKGGMGEVYRAYDVELKGEVALKVVSTDGDTDEALTRFRREIALARKVTNPNVLRVYDLADFRGLRFLSMEYVEGEDLGALLKREKRIPIERALQIFRQIAAGLAAAHAGGVVHRDLKPANILVDREGNVRIADFGLARSVTESGMTQSGSVLGSPSYMSPEQVKGEPTDGRSDIYSLGVMLYQLVSGQTPFQAPTSHAVMEMRLHKRPQPLREVAPEASLQIERVVDRCLEVEVDKRYPNVAAMLADLDNDPSRTAATVPPPSAMHSPSGTPAAEVPPAKRGFAIGLGVAAAAVIAGAVGLAAVRNPTTAANADAGANVALSPSGAGLAGGALVGTNDPVTTLVVGMENHTLESEFDGTLDFLVRSTLRRSTRVDPSAGAQVRRLASELGPDQKVDESLGKALFDRDHRRVITVRGRIDSKGAGFTLSLTAKDAGTGQTVVDKTMDAAALDRVVPTIAQLSCELRRALGEKISNDESEKTGLSASLIADHEYSLSAAAFEVGNYTSAADHLALALAQDPGFSSAHARRAIALRNLQREEESSRELQLALKTIDQMAERDRLKLLGDYYQYSTEELDRAVASYSELLAKWPRDDAAETNLANAYQARGETPKALELARRGASEHPQDLVLRGDVAAFDLGVDDFEGAVTDVRKMLTELPRPTTAMHDYLVIALAALGRHDEVMQALPAYRAIDPSNSAAFEADFAMSEGRLKDAKAILDKAIADDLTAKNPDGAEIKLAMLAELAARRGDKAGTHDAAAKIKAQPQRRFTAAMALLAIGDTKAAKAISASLGTELAPSRRVMAKMIDAEALRIAGKPRDAMLQLQDAIKLVDLPYAHFLLARAALDAKEFGEAYSELQHCQSHRGGFANSVDDVSAVRQLPLFTYYLAQAQDGLGSAQSLASYQAFLGMMHEPDADDPYVVDARKHAAATTPAK